MSLKKEDEDVRCQKCNSTQTRIRFITHERVCNKCGYTEKLKIGDRNGHI